MFAFSIFTSDIAFAQNQYRRPSRSDIEWLLGNNNKSKLPNRSTINIDENIDEDNNIITASVFMVQSDLPDPCGRVACTRNGSKLKNPSCKCEYCDETYNVEPCDKVHAKPNTLPQKIKQINFTTTTPQTTEDIIENAENNDEQNLENEQQNPQIIAIATGFPAKTKAINSTLNNKNSKQATIDFAVKKPASIETVDAQNNNSNENKVADFESDPIHLTTPQTSNITNPPANTIALSVRPEKQKILTSPQKNIKQKSHKNKINNNSDCNCGIAHENNHDSFYQQNDSIFSCKKNIYSNACSCGSCEQSVSCGSGEIFAETCIGILYRQINKLRYARLKHNAKHNGQCNCWLCSNLDNPDMVGNGIWNHHRVVGFGNNIIGISNSYTSPNMFLSRPDIATHFNAEARSRIWVDYRQFNNAAENAIVLNGNTIAALDRSINMFTFGIEKRIGTQTSLEVRVPLLYQFDSQFTALRNLQSGNTELGNITLASKYVFARTKRITLTTGLGVLLPTAEDYDLKFTNFFDASIENKAYNVVSYLAAQWHPNDSTFGHLLFQADIPVSKNEIRFGNQQSKIEESQILQLGLQLGRWFYRNECGMYSCRIGGFVEVDYATAINTADNIRLLNGNSFVGVNSTERKPDSLNIVAGLPITFGQLSVNNALIVPLLNDRQFSIAYNFSLCRKF
ncbi:MAG: hypothetical protein LBH59_06380 [Planctomycetaceae bacterium]|nr:hypothetical protein [Planctomycetaceae bacterium]